MATHIGTSETLPQIVITPNKGVAREGHGGQKADWIEDRLTPVQVRNKSAMTGRQAAQEAGDTVEGNGFWGTDGFTFGDLIDIINPLQHIPVVSTIYRAVTGDEIGAGPRMIGGGLLGGVAGFAAAAVGAAVENQTGMDVGDHVLVSMGLVEDEQVSIAAKRAQETGATLLSSKDPMTSVSEDMAIAAAEDVPPPPTAEEAMREAGISLTEQDISKDRAIYALGGLESATQRYQQVQSMNRLQSTALMMDVKG